VNRLRLLLLLLTLCGLSAPAQAHQLRGLPALNVAALATSTEELFVAGFDEGLFIVGPDGNARRFQDPALSPHINALSWSESTRTLWLGTARGLVGCELIRAARCRRVGPTSAVHALLQLDAGSLLGGGDAGLTFVDQRGARVFGKKQSAPFRSVWALAVAAGRLYVGTTNGLFWGAPEAFAPGGASLGRASLVSGNLPDDWVTALLPQKDRLFVGTYNAGVVSFTLGTKQPSSEASDVALGYVNPAGLSALGDDRLAVASMDGLHTGTLSATVRVATRGRDITAIVPAKAGGYWVGTRQGVEWLATLAP